MRARKSLGQHFLVDRRAVRRIVDALQISPGDLVGEIGPGAGALTSALVAAAGRVAAVELDDRCVRELRDRFDERQLNVIEADVLQVELTRILEALDAPPGGRLIVAGNLPYNISKPVVQKLIREREHVERAALMFQYEVARRLVAGPGSRSYGPFSVLAGWFYEIRPLFDLPPRSFRPPPRVRSSVTLWHKRPDPGLDTEGEARLRRCLAVCFARRRRTLRNNLRAVLPDTGSVELVLAEAGLSPDARAESVPPAGFLRLAELLYPHGASDGSRPGV